MIGPGVAKQPLQNLFAAPTAPTPQFPTAFDLIAIERLLTSIDRRLKFIQCRTGVWKCHRSLSPDPSPSTG